MKIRTIKENGAIKYPKWEDILNNQSILENNVPISWKRKEIVYLTLTAFLLSCSNIKLGNEKYKTNENTINKEKITQYKDTQIMNYENRPYNAYVAPVFIHGTGYGSGGCMSIAPAVYLTENEALSIIDEEFEKAGIIFSRKSYVTNAKYNIKTSFENRWKEQNNRGDFLTDSLVTNITLDRYNEELNLGIEFFGKEGSDIFKDINEKSITSSVWSFNAKAAAQKARDVMEDYGKINFGVFYDPAVGSKDKQYSINQLKQQIHDFLEWYKYNSNN
jgi:hypothetical protein